MLAGIDLNGAAGSFISIGATNTAFGDLLRRIMSSSQNLPLLPRMYTTSCRSVYAEQSSADKEQLSDICPWHCSTSMIPP
jgi:hypothetical protein